MRLRILFFIIALLNVGCVINNLAVTPVPLYQQTAFKENKNVHLEKFKSLVDSPNEIVQAGESFFVERTPLNDYILKIFDMDLDLLISKISFSNGGLLTKNGEETQWADNGKIIHHGYYQKGEKFYKWKYYNLTDGLLELEGRYQAGRKVGKWTKYDKTSKQVKEELKFVSGIPEYFSKDKYFYERELDCLGAFGTTLYHINKVDLKSKINKNASLSISRSLISCEAEKKEAINCTKKIINEWKRNIRREVKGQNIKRVINAIVILKIHPNGKSEIEIVRGVSDKVRSIIKNEFDKMNFNFVPDEGSSNVTSYVLAL